MTRPPRARPNGRPAGRGRRGAVLPLACILLTVLLGCAALAIDLSRLYYAAGEAQAAADAAALAAARAMQLQAASSASVAPTAATSLASKNRIAGQNAAVVSVKPKLYSPTSAAGSVVPDAAWGSANAVQVTVKAQTSYVLARALGLSPPLVQRSSTAWIANVDAASCVMPILLPYTSLYYLGFPSPTRAPNAPDVTQPQLNQINAWAPSYKTVVLVPPNVGADTLYNKGYKNYGNWMPADFTGGTAAMNDFGDWVRQRNCASARAQAKQAGVVTMAWTRNGGGGSNSALWQVTNNMPSHCNFRAANKATCWSSAGATVPGVRTRIVYGDFPVSTTASGQAVTVRAVGELVLMCYFRASTDVCPDQTGYPNGGWSGSYWPDTGYPEGTVIGVVEAPVSVDLQPTTLLGDIPTNVQRLVLVR